MARTSSSRRVIVVASGEYAERLKRALKEENLSAEEVERGLQQALSLHAQLLADLELLERDSDG